MAALHNFLRNNFRPKEWLGHYCTPRQHNRLANIALDIQGVNCRVYKPTDQEGRGWRIIVDGTSDINGPPPPWGDGSLPVVSVYKTAGGTSVGTDTLLTEVVDNIVVEDAGPFEVLDAGADDGNLQITPPGGATDYTRYLILAQYEFYSDAADTTGIPYVLIYIKEKTTATILTQSQAISLGIPGKTESASGPDVHSHGLGYEGSGKTQWCSMFTHAIVELPGSPATPYKYGIQASQDGFTTCTASIGAFTIIELGPRTADAVLP